jgi:hypothetical protein
VEGRAEDAACIPSAKCLTGKIRAIHRIHCEVLLPNGMKILGRDVNIKVKSR